MYCTSCGTENRDGTNFCKHCGAPMPPSVQTPPPQTVDDSQPRPQPSIQVQNFYGDPAVSAAPYACQPSPAGVVKRLASSPVFLIAVLLSTLSTLMGIVCSNSLLAGIEERFYSMLPGGMMTFEMEEIMDEVFRTLSSTSVLSAILSNIPTILILVGLWITVISALRKKNVTISTGGLTLIRVLYIIMLVLICMVLAGCEIGIAALTVTVLKEYDYAFLGAILMVWFAVAFGLMILFEALIISSLGAASRSARTNVPCEKASVFVAVILIIGAVFGILSGLMTIVVSVPAGISGVLSNIANILFAVTIFKYRSAMGDAKWYSVNQPAYVENLGSYYNPQAAYAYAGSNMAVPPAASQPYPPAQEPSVPAQTPPVPTQELPDPEMPETCLKPDEDTQGNPVP